MRCRIKLNGNDIKVCKTAIVPDIPLQNKFSFIRKIANIVIRKVPKTASCENLLFFMNLNCQKMKDKIQKSATVKRRQSSGKKAETDCKNGASLSDEQKAGKDKTMLSVIRAIKKKRCLDKIKRLRCLKHYKEIDAFLSDGKKNLARNKIESLNCITPKNKNNIMFWNHHVYIARQIEYCIYKQDWNNLTRFLIIFSNFPKQQKQLLLEASLINFVGNPVSQRYEMLEDFLKECFSCRGKSDIDQLLTNYFHIKTGRIE